MGSALGYQGTERTLLAWEQHLELATDTVLEGASELGLVDTAERVRVEGPAQ
jgi:hypothetical protein